MKNKLERSIERLQLEHLEERDCPVIYGTFFQDTYFIIRDNPLSWTTSPEPVINGTEGDDLIYAIGAPFTINGLGGNDTIYGGDYADTIFGGSGSDCILAGGGIDYLYGEEGVDYLIGGYSELPDWTGSLHDRVLSALELDYTTQGDFLDGGTDFNLEERTYSYDTLGVTYLSEGTYNWGDFKTNNTKFIGVGEVIFVGTRFDVKDIYLENVKIDITGLYPYPQGYINSFTGNVVLNNVEVYGQNSTNTQAVYFNAKFPTQAVMLNSYVHDTFGDCISTGNALNASVSLLELFNVVGARSGPAENNQVLTAHQGFSVVDVGGNYSDARSNVVAPDNSSSISLNYTTISRGNRFAGVQLNSLSQISHSTLYDQYTLNVMYEMNDVDIYTHSYTTNYFITVQPTGKIKYSYVKKMGTSNNALRNLGGELVDNVFEGW